MCSIASTTLNKPLYAIKQVHDVSISPTLCKSSACVSCHRGPGTSTLALSAHVLRMRQRPSTAWDLLGSHGRCVRRAVYVYVSYRLFQLTNVLRIAVIPAKAGAELLRNAIIIAACTGALVAAGALLLRLQLLGQ